MVHSNGVLAVGLRNRKHTIFPALLGQEGAPVQTRFRKHWLARATHVPQKPGGLWQLPTALPGSTAKAHGQAGDTQAAGSERRWQGQKATGPLLFEYNFLLLSFPKVVGGDVCECNPREEEI